MSAASLASLAVGVKTADDVLERFVAHVADAGLSLYPAQEEAILELCAGKHVILNTPTGSGKSLVATALHFKALAEGRVSYYTCPIKALVNEKFFALCNEFGAENVGMLTGDAAINPGAKIICCTAEILANLALRDRNARVEYVVMDEFHYYSDKERGVAWQIPLLICNDATFLLMSATLGDVSVIEKSLVELTRREVAVVRSTDRPVPLEYDYSEKPLHETLEKLIALKRYPVYLVNFTQRAAAEQAQNLTSINICTKEEKLAIAEAINDFKFDTPYAKDFQRFIRAGIGLHHAGLLPKYRLLVEKLAQQGLLKVVSGTDTLGMGINIPIRTVLFTQLCKYDGEKSAILSVRDFHQIAGRAGRKGYDDRGYVVVQAPEHVIENIKLQEKKASGKKVVMQKPPQKGYVHWDRETFERILEKKPEPLESRFVVTHGMLLALLQGDPRGYRRLVEIIRRSHSNDWGKRQLRRTAATLFRTLRKAGLINVITDERARHPIVEVSQELQHDFSLHHTLALFLVETVKLVDPASANYALDILSLVESILENPMVVLFAQVNRAKTEKLGELKMAGVEYAERMEELDKITWPKPGGEFIYDAFNAFVAKHPWVGQENIRPKSVARDMVERFASFHDYVREFDLQRSEGVLLRYVSESYKALLQTVPQEARTEEIDDILDLLRSMLRTVDSSLLDEWQHLRDPSNPARQITLVPQKQAAVDDVRSVAARVRGELHRLLKALSDKQYEEAAAMVRAPEGDAPWTAERLAEALAPYWAEHARIDVTPRARRPAQTELKAATEEGTFTARQRILDPEEDEDWMLDCFVDMRRARAEAVDASNSGTAPTTAIDRPLLELRSIGR